MIMQLLSTYYTELRKLAWRHQTYSRKFRKLLTTGLTLLNLPILDRTCKKEQTHAGLNLRSCHLPWWWQFENISRLTTMLSCWYVGLFSSISLYNSTFKVRLDELTPIRTKEMPRRSLLPSYNKDIQAEKRRKVVWEAVDQNRCVCVFIRKCSRSIKFRSEMPLSLPRQNITKKRSNHPREIKEDCF